jgi:tRNA modification GTPase
MTPEPETIATVRTPPGRGGIAVVALVGPRAESILSGVFRPLGRDTPREGELQLGHVVSDGRPLDEAVVSRTSGCVELQVHGGGQVLRSVLELLAARGATVVPAEAAGVADLPAAHARWDNPAIGQELLALLPRARSQRVAEALSAQWAGGISELARRPSPEPAALRSAAEGLATMRRLLEPAEVVLAGPPNAGKSALANALVGRAVSIVHEAPGTTRDWVREEALLEGLPVWLTDTAGIWRPQAAEDAEAVGRARERVQQADVVVLVEPGRQGERPDWCPPQRVLRVSSKADAVPAAADAAVAVSAETGEGLDALRKAVLSKLGLGGFDPRVPRAFTRRQAARLRRAAKAAEAGDTTARDESLGDLLAGDVTATP